MKAFFDTSAFAKRYIAERGSERVVALCDDADALVVSVVCLPELVSSLCRLVREKKLGRADYRRLKGIVATDLMDVDICQITSPILDATIPLLETHPLRSTDALHVACALAVEPDMFVSADRRQLVAARKSGLRTVDVS
ncbi:MAG: type II toxin-antitoxin system VapC family toxin [Pseudomonadota bacterium]|nr:type II toxin-antitoxin system VapC family toxin [Pseudomonadota bacterium]